MLSARESGVAKGSQRSKGKGNKRANRTNSLDRSVSGHGGWGSTSEKYFSAGTEDSKVGNSRNITFFPNCQDPLV